MAGNEAAAKLADFMGRHEYTVANALAVYAERMNKESAEALAAYESIKDDPAKVIEQDKTLMTTRGLRHAGLAFKEAADSAKAALEAWRDLADTDEW